MSNEQHEIHLDSRRHLFYRGQSLSCTHNDLTLSSLKESDGYFLMDRLFCVFLYAHPVRVTEMFLQLAPILHVDIISTRHTFFPKLDIYNLWKTSFHSINGMKGKHLMENKKIKTTILYATSSTATVCNYNTF